MMTYDYNLDDEDMWEVLYDHPFDKYEPEEYIDAYSMDDTGDDYFIEIGRDISDQEIFKKNALPFKKRPLVVAWNGAYVVLEKSEKRKQCEDYYQVVSTVRKLFCVECDVIKNSKSKSVKYRFLVPLETFCGAIKAKYPGLEIVVFECDGFVNLSDLLCG